MRIRAYSANGELDLTNNVLAQRDAFTLGTRVLLICDVTGLPQGDKLSSYKWEHNCTGGTHGRCEIRDRDPYYRVVNDTLLVDVISSDTGGTTTAQQSQTAGVTYKTVNYTPTPTTE